VQLRLELLLEPPQPVVVQAHIAQHLRRDFVVRIKPLKLLLKVDSLQALRIQQLLHPRRGLLRDTAGNPGKAVPGIQAVGNLLLGRLPVFGVGVHYRRQRVRHRLLVLDLRRHRENRIHLHGHRQLVQIPVVEHPAPRSHLERPLLLLLRTPLKLVVAHHLQPEQPGDNQPRPEHENPAHSPEARPPQRHYARC